MVTCCATMLPSLDSPTIASCTLATGTRTVSEALLLTRRDRGVDDVPLSLRVRSSASCAARETASASATSTVSVALTRWARPVVGAIVLSASPPETVPDSVAPSPDALGAGVVESAPVVVARLFCRIASAETSERDSPTTPALANASAAAAGIAISATRRTGKRNRLNGACDGLSAESSRTRALNSGGAAGREAELVDQFRRRRHGLSSSLRASRAPDSAASRRRSA